MMSLADWLKKQKMSDSTFARAIDVHKAQIYRWHQGAIPRAKYMRLIVRVTSGEVTEHDFYLNRERMARRRERAARQTSPRSAE